MVAWVLRAASVSLLAARVASADPGAGEAPPAPVPPVSGANGTLTAAVLAGVDSFGPGMGLRLAAGAAGPRVRFDAGVVLRFARGDLHAVGGGASAPGSVVRAGVELAFSRAQGRVRPWASAGLTRVAAQVDGDTYALCDSSLCPSVETEGPSGSATGLEVGAGVHVVAAPHLLLGVELRWTAVDEVALEGATPVQVGGPWFGVSLTARR